MKRLLLLTTSLLSLATAASAQDEPPKYLRFLPLGELPVWKEELKNGIRMGKEPPPGSMPPKELALLSGGEVVPFQLTLRSFTGKMRMDGKTPGLAIKKGKGVDDPNWVTSAKPTAPLSLAVLYRDPATMKWDNPQIKVLPDDASSFKVKNIRFVNVSENLVLIKLNDGKGKGVKKGDSLIMPLKEGMNKIMVGYQAAGGKQVELWNNQIRVQSNQRVQCFFYKAQDARATGAVRFYYTQEPAP